MKIRKIHAKQEFHAINIRLWMSFLSLGDFNGLFELKLASIFRNI